MGLGLAMVKNIVETYGGSITFESVQDGQTIFTVTIPQYKSN
jgi:signal transduction histidine kinase